MIVYVKECSAINISTIIPWLFKTIEVRPLVSIKNVTTNDILIISNTDNSIHDDLSNYNTIIYEDFFGKLSLNIRNELKSYHDYYYLRNALLDSKKPNISTIIAGSSYGAFGIDLSLLHNTVNLSSISQDLYYSLKLIYSACENNEHIKNIVLCMGYYYFFTDLSKTKNPNEIQRISKVYKPLFNDIHNCTILPPKQNILYESEIFNIQAILNTCALSEYKKGFFNQDRPRKNYATKEWDDKTKNWSELSFSEKTEAGRRRATLHNRNIKREASLQENVYLFHNFLNFCKSKKINLLLVVTPSTPYYRACLSPEYKSTFYDVLNESDDIIHLLDLSDDSSFTDEDFVDTDHLNDKGARKMTSSIFNVLKEIENS